MEAARIASFEKTNESPDAFWQQLTHRHCHALASRWVSNFPQEG